MFKKILSLFILVILFISLNLALAQNKKDSKLPSFPIQLPYKVILEETTVSNDIPVRFTIRIKNNSEKTVTLANYKIEISIRSNLNRGWVPKLILESPSENTTIMPGKSINLVYKISREDTLIAIDEGKLIPNTSNQISIYVYIKGEEGYEYSRFFYERDFFWKPKMADFAIKDVKIEFLGYSSDPYYKGKIKAFLSVENIGDTYPILYGDNKKINESLVQMKLVRKKDGKSFYLQMEPIGEVKIGEYAFGPKTQVELPFISKYSLPGIDITGDFDIIVSFDEEIDKKANITYYHLFSDGNRENNTLVKLVAFNNVFDLGAFYPKRVSILKPAGVKSEFPRLEQDLMYIDVKSYVRIDLIDDSSTIKVYFNNEPLRIFSIIVKDTNNYKVWFERPKRVGKGKIKVELAGITRFSKDDLEVTESFIFSPALSSSDISWPFYFEASPNVYLFYFGKDEPKPPYGSIPISIDNINIRGNAPINISIALRSAQITWFDTSKGTKDIPPSADLRYYAGSNRYAIEIYIRPSNKLKWQLLEYIEAPVTIETNKRSIITVKLDEIKKLVEGNLTSGENELLIQVIYTFETKERYVANQEVKEVIMKYVILSDMYWTRFKI